MTVSLHLQTGNENESDDEFYDCKEVPEDIRSLTKWNSMELVRDTESDEHDGLTAPPDLRQSVAEPVFKELRRTVSYQAESNTKRKMVPPSLDIPEISEPTCSTSVLILVVHGGSILDPATDLAVRKSDVTTFRGAFESIMRQHYPGLVGHLVMKCVACPSTCSDTIDTLASLSPYSSMGTDRLPITAIPLFFTKATNYHHKVTQMVSEANKVYRNFLDSEEGFGFSGPVCLIGDSVGAILAYDALCRGSTAGRGDNSDSEDLSDSDRHKQTKNQTHQKNTLT